MHDLQPLFRIKICGVTSLVDAEAAIAAGADAIGLNFFQRSSRFIERRDATHIAGPTAGRVLRVGVFVNSYWQDVDNLAHDLRLDAVQLHGDEAIADHAHLAGWRLIRAVRVDAASAGQAVGLIRDLQQSGARLASVLIDARHASSYGGTGQTVDWGAAAWLRSQLHDIPVVLAGGLNPGNVADAILAVRPSGVDVASGIESVPGVKDAGKMTAFVASARAALAEAGR